MLKLCHLFLKLFVFSLQNEKNKSKKLITIVSQYVFGVTSYVWLCLLVLVWSLATSYRTVWLTTFGKIANYERYCD